MIYQRLSGQSMVQKGAFKPIKNNKRLQTKRVFVPIHFITAWWLPDSLPYEPDEAIKLL